MFTSSRYLSLKDVTFFHCKYYNVVWRILPHYFIKSFLNCLINKYKIWNLQGAGRKHTSNLHNNEVFCCLVAKSCSDSFETPWTTAARFLCPWDFPGKNHGVGCYFLLQGIFPTQGSNPHLLRVLYWQADSLPTESTEKPP